RLRDTWFAGRPDLINPFRTRTQASEIRVVHRTPVPARTRATLVAKAGPYPKRAATRPPSKGPKIDPKPWTALKAPRARARPPSGARWDTSVQIAKISGLSNPYTCERKIGKKL